MPVDHPRVEFSYHTAARHGHSHMRDAEFNSMLTKVRADNPLPQVVGASIKLIRAGNELKACCPFHPDRSPSFTIFAGGERFHCFGCGASGDVLDYVQRAYNITLRQAADMLGAGNLPLVQIRPLPSDDGADRVEEAKTIWRSAAPASGTPAEVYLRSRGLHLPIPESIRFARLPYGKKGRQHPCLIAAVASHQDKLIGIQRTYLTASGSGKAAVPKPKLSLGRVGGGAIRLAPGAVDLIVTEGLEDGLTLQQEIGRAVWVAAGASMLPLMLFPAGVRSVAIGGDNDETGRAAAENAAATFAGRGLSTRMFFPVGAKDFNEELMGARK